MKILFAAPFSGVRTSLFISGYYDSLARAAIRQDHKIVYQVVFSKIFL